MNQVIVICVGGIKCSSWVELSAHGHHNKTCNCKRLASTLDYNYSVHTPKPGSQWKRTQALTFNDVGITPNKGREGDKGRDRREENEE